MEEDQNLKNLKRSYDNMGKKSVLENENIDEQIFVKDLINFENHSYLETNQLVLKTWRQDKQCSNYNVQAHASK
jgi:hypothetical protein